MVRDAIERCPTGVPGFDELCNGGFVRNSVNVVLGGPGAGKTTFLLQFLWEGVTEYDENGLYISFEPDILDIFEDAMNYGWDFSKYEASGKCKFVKFSPKASIRDMKEELTKLVAKYDVKRVVFDPMSVLAMSIDKESDVRELIFDLTSLLKRLKVTVVLADETPDGSTENYSLGESNIKTQFIKFLSDSLVNLFSAGLGGVSDRAVRITKMRRTNHTRGPVDMKITNKGITISGK